MLESVIAWLDQAMSVVFWSALAAFVVINGAAAVLFVTRRSRDAVNRWTAPLLAANLLLVGAGAAVPATMYVTRIALASIATTSPALITVTE